MDFEGLFKTVAEEWRVIQHAPFSFSVAVILAGLILWRLIEWHHKGTIASLEGRLKLRDDEMAQLSRTLDRNARNDSAPVAAEEAIEVISRNEQDIAREEYIPPPRNPLPWLTDTPESEREYLPPGRTPEELFSILDGVTTAQGQAVAKTYLGKWMRTTQVVNDVDRRSDHFVVLALVAEGGARFMWMHFKPSLDLSTVHRGDTLTIVGRVDELRFGTLRLHECEIVHPD